MFKIAEFRARDREDLPMSNINCEYENGWYYWIASNGTRSIKYRVLEDIKKDVVQLYGKWKDFKLLV